MLEIVEREAIESYGCAQAHARLTAGSMRGGLVSMGWPYGCSTSQEVAGSIPYIVLAQFRLELTKLSCQCPVNPLTNAHLPVPVPPGPRLFQRQGVWLRFSD